MYTRLFLNRTKNKYKEILNIALNETRLLVERNPEMGIYKVIYDQLTDIKDNIIIKNKIFTENEIFNKYTLGAIAVKNFDIEHDEYGQKLSDIFGGAVDYHQMPEE